MFGVGATGMQGGKTDKFPHWDAVMLVKCVTDFLMIDVDTQHIQINSCTVDSRNI